MSRIVFLEFSNVTWTKETIFDAHAEGFINALKRCGNKVLVVCTNAFVQNQLTNRLIPQVDEDKILKRITDFNPELIITYNNSLPGERIIESTTCPILLYPADVPMYWPSVNLIKENIQRYFFLSVNETMDEAIEMLLGDDIKKRLVPFGYVTEVKSCDVTQDINISFVGSIGNYSDWIVDYFQRIGKLNIPYKEKNEIKNCFFEAFDDFSKNTLKEIDFSFPFSNMEENIKKSINPSIILMMTCKKRLDILSQFTDLGLHIYGYPESWAKVIQYNYDVFKCFDYRLCVSLSDYLDVYNRSKISINLPHGNVGVGFSWRVCDILASNAVLLSVKKADLVKLMLPYIKMPFFESQQEARDLAIQLLKEPNWRKELVEASHQMINDNCRYEKKFIEIEKFIPKNMLKLLNDDIGNIEEIKIETVYKDEIIEERQNRITNNSIKSKLIRSVKFWKR